MSDFKLCARGGTLAALDTLNLPDPQFTFHPYAEVVRVGNGNAVGVGAPYTEWEFPLLTLTERNVLAGYVSTGSGLVTIVSPNLGGTFKQFDAVMTLPENEPAIKGGFLKGYVVKFSHLVEVTP